MTEVKLKDCLVYLVDDDQGMVNSTTQWLTLSGLQVKAFSQPLALLKQIKPQIPAVIISDIRMPDMDGLQLMEQILNKDSHIPTILITGHGDVPLAVEAMKMGAFEFLTKPFSPDDLLKIVQQAQLERIEYLNQIHAKPDDQDNLQHNVKQKMDEYTAQLGTELNSEDLSTRTAHFEKTIIEDALVKHDGNIASVLIELGIPRRTLNEKMKRLGILRKNYKKL